MTIHWHDCIQGLRVGTGVTRWAGARWPSPIVMFVGLALVGCSSGPSSQTPPDPQPRAIDAMCVLDADVFTTTVTGLNQKVFSAPRDSTSNSTFGDFRPIAGPFGNSSLGNTNLDNLPSVYAISETWFRGIVFNEAVRADVEPAFRTDATGERVNGETSSGTGVRWDVFAQDFTGAWKGMFPNFRHSAYKSDEFAVGDQPTTIAQLPQWMHTGEASPQLFFCAGEITTDGAESTTSLFEYTPVGRNSRARPDIMEIQDVLNGDDRFVPDPPPDPPLGGRRVAPPVPGISAPTPGMIFNQIVQCAMTQNGDDVTSRRLHLVTINGSQLLHAMLSNFGPVTQLSSTGSTSTFSRFRTISPWQEIRGRFPAISFGSLDHVAAVATGRDNILQIFFVAHGNDGRYRLWHTTRFDNDFFSTPVDVLSASGDSNTGTIYDMPITASFCPAPDNRTPTLAEVGEEIVLTWNNLDLRSILVQEVVRYPANLGHGEGGLCVLTIEGRAAEWPRAQGRTGKRSQHECATDTHQPAALFGYTVIRGSRTFSCHVLRL